MNFRGFTRFVVSGIILTGVILLGFIILQWLHLPAGRFIDWLIGIIIFWWLLIIVTFPWNIHFQAREVLAEADRSQEDKIFVKPEQLAYASRWVKRSLIIALALHTISAGGLYLLALVNISPLGYFGAGAALLLTGLRPIVRGYEYLVKQLTMIQKEVRYPREDVVKLRHDMQKITGQVETLQAQLDPDDNLSWAAQQQAQLTGLTQGLDQVRLNLNDLHTTNQAAHAQLSREAEQAIAQITADGQFLDHVREIIRFVKRA